MILQQVRAWFVRFGNFFNSEKQDHDFEQEINSHLQMHIDDLVQFLKGMEKVLVSPELQNELMESDTIMLDNL